MDYSKKSTVLAVTVLRTEKGRGFSEITKLTKLVRHSLLYKGVMAVTVTIECLSKITIT